MLELPTVDTFENIVTELKCVRCRNSRRMSELPTVGIPDLRRNSQPSWHLKTSRWPLVVYTGHVQYDHHSEYSILVKLRDVGTPDLCRNSRRTNPRTTTLPLLGKYRTRPVSYCQINKTQVSSFVSQTLKTHMGWLEHLWNIIYQHDASLLIVQHSYLLKFKSITN